jgi:MFS family permease
MERELTAAGVGGEERMLGRAGVILVACICGWFVMELEILGVRMLTPYFGSAITVVTGSVIGTFLLSLAVGYLLGGWMSGRPWGRRGLGLSVAGAGLWMGLLPWITGPVCDAVFDWGLDDKWGSLLAALALFAVPTTLLGTVSPAVVRRLTRRSDDSGFNAGLVSATSTIASFAGCVVTAFYLILISMKLTLWISGAILLALGLVLTTLSILPSRPNRVREEL